MEIVANLFSVDFFIAVVFASVAGLMRGFAGFGSGMLMAPVFALLFGPVETVAMIILMELLISAQLVRQAAPDIEWRFVAPMGAAAAVFMPVGSWVLASADPQALTRAMAVIVLVFVLILVTGWRYRGKKRLVPTLGVGAVSGALMAATSMGNPPVLLYMFAGPDQAAANRANIIAYFVITQAVLLIEMLLVGLMSWPAVVRALMLMPAYMLTTWIGSRLFRQSSEALYRRTAFVFLLGVAIYGLLR